MNAQKRDELRQALQKSIGREEAATLMEHLPPDRWDELATKKDLADALADYPTKDDLSGALASFPTKDDLANAIGGLASDMGHLETRMDLKMDAQGHRLEALFRERIDHSTRVTVFALMTAMLTSTGLSLGVVMLGA